MNTIAILNIGDVWQPNAKASVLAAAERWGCAVYETRSLSPREHVFAAKFRVGLEALNSTGDRCLYLDADMVIRTDCPSPFGLVPYHYMAGVRNFQEDTHGGDHEAHQAESWEVACAQLGVDREYDVDWYINGGFILFSNLHRPVLKTLQERITDPSGVYEQAAWGVLLKEVHEGRFTGGGGDAVILPRTWNRIGEAVWTSGPVMSAYIYHFANYFNFRGQQEKNERIAALNWRQVPQAVTA